MNTISIDAIVSFSYKGGRKVKGKVIYITKTGFTLELYNDYIGRNEEWYKGESKAFNMKETKNFKILNSN